MLFTSFNFALFIFVLLLIYWTFGKNNLRIQNFSLLIASYLFYSFCNWKFLFLIGFYSIFNFYVGLLLEKSENVGIRKVILTVSCIVSIGLLCFFKYYNFFVNSFVDLFHFFNINFNVNSLKIILPVGISFYTFQTLSYTFDIYRRLIKPTRDLFSFMVFVSFFPQLLAGPIAKANHLLPQFSRARQFDNNNFKDGLRQILWGLFKKMVVADNVGLVVNNIYANYANLSGSTIFIGVLLYSIQIYADFSGYSDIAIGSAKLLGINLRQNFSYPIFSRDVGEFWRRWHMSLQQWFKEYLYYPLGGSRGNKWLVFRNTMIIFGVSGLWHGADWKFVIWGLLNGLLFLPLILAKKNRKNIDVVAKGKLFPSIPDIGRILLTFILIALIRIFFRSDSFDEAIHVIGRLCSSSLFSIPHLQIGINNLIFISLMLITEWVNREREHGLYLEPIKTIGLRWGIYYSLILIIILYPGEQQNFIYFQF